MVKGHQEESFIQVLEEEVNWKDVDSSRVQVDDIGQSDYDEGLYLHSRVVDQLESDDDEY